MAIDSSAHLYRVDRFVVPDAARQEFLGRVRGTHYILQAQPGFVRDMVLEQRGGPGTFNIVTMVEWEDQAAIDAAKRVVAAAHERAGFNPQETLKRLGIEADIGNYQPINV